MECLGPTDGQRQTGSCLLTCPIRCLERGCSSAAAVGWGRTLPTRGNPTALCTHLTGYCGPVPTVPAYPAPSSAPTAPPSRAVPIGAPRHHRLLPGSHPAWPVITSRPTPRACRGQGSPLSHCPQPRVPLVPSTLQHQAIVALRPLFHPGTWLQPSQTGGCGQRHIPRIPGTCTSASICRGPPAWPHDAQPGPSPPDLSYLPVVAKGWARPAGARSPAASPLLPAWDQNTFKTLPFPAPGDDTTTQPCQKHAGQPSPPLPPGAQVPPCRGSSCTQPLRPHHRPPCAVPLREQE